MPFSFAPFKEAIKNTEERLARDLAQVRTGRATPALLDAILVEAYGSKLSIRELASIGIEDPRTLRVSPYDPSLVKNIEQAVTSANLGLSVAVDERGVRVSFPSLTAERRGEMVKIARTKLEEARVSLRNERDMVWNAIQKMEKEGKMGEDEKFRAKDEMQKFTDEANKHFEEQMERKEKEILS